MCITAPPHNQIHWCETQRAIHSVVYGPPGLSSVKIKPIVINNGTEIFFFFSSSKERRATFPSKEANFTEKKNCSSVRENCSVNQSALLFQSVSKTYCSASCLCIWSLLRNLPFNPTFPLAPVKHLKTGHLDTLCHKIIFFLLAVWTFPVQSLAVILTLS